MIKVKLLCEIEVPFHGYKTKTLNRRAISKIKREVTETLREHCSCIAIRDIEKVDGCWIDDCSSTTKIKVSMK